MEITTGKVREFCQSGKVGPCHTDTDTIKLYRQWPLSV